MMNVMRMLVAIGMFGFGAGTVWADTPKLPIQMIDSLTASSKYLTLAGYTNPACDNNRILIQNSDPALYKEMVTMVFGAFYSGSLVSFALLEGGGQCTAKRIYVYNQ